MAALPSQRVSSRKDAENNNQHRQGESYDPKTPVNVGSVCRNERDLDQQQEQPRRKNCAMNVEDPAG
jgi:hypothetical protein